MELGSGKKLIVEAEKVSAENKYIQSATLNARPLNRAWISHTEIKNGATLQFIMGPTPNPNWASAPESAPPAFEELYKL